MVGSFHCAKSNLVQCLSFGSSNWLQTHPVINVSALKRYMPNTFDGRKQPPPAVTDLGGHTRYIVEAVLKSRRVNNGTRYLVKWRGYPEPTWEPDRNLKDESGKNSVPLAKFLRS